MAFGTRGCGGDGAAAAAPPPTVLLAPRAPSRAAPERAGDQAAASAPAGQDSVSRLQGEAAERQAQDESWKAQFLAMRARADLLERQTGEIRSGMEALIGAVERKDRELEIARDEIRRLTSAQPGPPVAALDASVPQVARRWSSVSVSPRAAQAPAPAGAQSPGWSSQGSAAVSAAVPSRSPSFDGHLRSPAAGGAATPRRPPASAQDAAGRRCCSPAPCSSPASAPRVVCGTRPRGVAEGRRGRQGGRSRREESASASTVPRRAAARPRRLTTAQARPLLTVQRVALHGAATAGHPAKGRQPLAAPPAAARWTLRPARARAP
ncbi:unnamed protein product, partial [Prorocentrum cordatum]